MDLDVGFDGSIASFCRTELRVDRTLVVPASTAGQSRRATIRGISYAEIHDAHRRVCSRKCVDADGDGRAREACRRGRRGLQHGGALGGQCEARRGPQARGGAAVPRSPARHAGDRYVRRQPLLGRNHGACRRAEGLRHGVGAHSVLRQGSSGQVRGLPADIRRTHTWS